MPEVVETKETRAKKPVPAIRDEKGILRKLKGLDFPTSRAGKTAFHEYQIERHKEAILDIQTADDPKKKLERKLKKHEAMLVALRKEAAEQGITV